jgi:hypothetical protein
MPDYKHVGRVKTNQRKVIVAYRVIPGDPENALVVQTENLNADEHDSLIKLVESSAGQSAYEFAEAMARAVLPDGRNMLAGFHKTGKLNKVPSDLIEMIPNRASIINLKQLNETIAQQRGVTVADLALKGPNGQTVQPIQATQAEPINTVDMYATSQPNDGILSDEDLAAQYRSQADALFKEAKALREQAEALAPTKKRTKQASESA